MADEVGRRASGKTPTQQADVCSLAIPIEGALPIQKRHLEAVRDAALTHAGREDPHAER